MEDMKAQISELKKGFDFLESLKIKKKGEPKTDKEDVIETEERKEGEKKEKGAEGKRLEIPNDIRQAMKVINMVLKTGSIVIKNAKGQNSPTTMRYRLVANSRYKASTRDSWKEPDPKRARMEI